jgi:hypothetical protein
MPHNPNSSVFSLLMQLPAPPSPDGDRRVERHGHPIVHYYIVFVERAREDIPISDWDETVLWLVHTAYLRGACRLLGIGRGNTFLAR